MCEEQTEHESNFQMTFDDKSERVVFANRASV